MFTAPLSGETAFPCRPSSDVFRNGISSEPVGSPRSKAFKEGQISSSSKRVRSGKNLEPSSVRSIVFPCACSFLGVANVPPFCCSVVSRSGLLVSVSSLLSKTMRPSESIDRWFSSSPFAPPSSKSEEAFLNKGSTENSSSNFLSCREANDEARVDSDDLCA